LFAVPFPTWIVAQEKNVQAGGLASPAVSIAWPKPPTFFEQLISLDLPDSFVWRLPSCSLSRLQPGFKIGFQPPTFLAPFSLSDLACFFFFVFFLLVAAFWYRVRMLMFVPQENPYCHPALMVFFTLFLDLYRLHTPDTFLFLSSSTFFLN